MLADQVSILTVTLLTALLSVVTALLLLLYKQTKRSQYDAELHRAQLDQLRAYFESQIHRLTDRLLSTEDRWRDVNHLIISSMQRMESRPSAEKPAGLTAFVKSFGIKETDLDIEKDLVFVLTPFHEEFQDTYETIQKACNKVGLRCLRGDEEFVSGDLLPHILSLIVRARLIIANIDSRNPNVFYELGIAQALDKPTIIVASSVPDMPFDLRTRKIIIFRDSGELLDKLQTELTRTLVRRT